jgi:pimeloyl-ACP methyl ester carboxylesterase
VEQIAVTQEGKGPAILLVHGGASPRTTWGALTPLSARWTLLFVHRRGYPPSPPGRHDFELDAADLGPLLVERPHVVAHSYGVLGALIAAARAPENVRSLTLIEPPLCYLVPGDPEVAHLEYLGDTFLTEGLDGDPSVLREFLHIAGAPSLGDGSLPAPVAHAVHRAQGARLPSEARLQLDVLREAAVPSLVASGDHAPALERICDALAEALGAQRVVAPGAGHFVAAAPAFAGQLEQHLAAVEASR